MPNSGFSSFERPSSIAGWRTEAPIVRAITSAWIVVTQKVEFLVNGRVIDVCGQAGSCYTGGWTGP